MSTLKIVFQLTKFRFSFLVSFSAIFGFVLASDSFRILDLLILGFSGYLVTASSVINNQILEKELDEKMDRTKKRPLPTNKISKYNSLIISLIFMFFGLFLMLFFFNVIAFLLSLASLIIYTFVYTPLEKSRTYSSFCRCYPRCFTST